MIVLGERILSSRPIYYGLGKSKNLVFKITDDHNDANLYDFLIRSVEHCRKQLKEKAQASRKSEGYAS